MSAWLPDETERMNRVLRGETVVANLKRDHNLIAWAKSVGRFALIDRRTNLGNPFVIGRHGDRDQVCDAYRDRFLRSNPPTSPILSQLRGKVLGCWCYPERCHGESLVELVHGGAA